MPGASYNYVPGGFSLTSDGPMGGGMMGGSNPDLDFFREMAKRKAMQADEDRARRIRLEDQAMARALAPQMGGGPSAIDRQLDMSNKRAQIMKNNAATQAPMLDPLIALGNTGNSYQQMNPARMNAFQREMYLPGGSSMSGNINASGFDERDAFEREMAMRKKQMEREPDTRADFHSLGSFGR